MHVAIIVGTRPEIIKAAPVIKKYTSKNSSIIFTGQHYDYSMGLSFIDQLGLRRPDHSLKISHSNAAIQTGEIISKLVPILQKIKPDTVILIGDTNTALAAGICSLKSNIPISHIESGSRSYDWRMPEEHNRIALDHLSELLFAPSTDTKTILESEKVHGKIYMVGNTTIDAVNMYSKISKQKSQIRVDLDDYILMTLHRAENVDDKTTLSLIIKGIIDSNATIVFPIHPRTKKRLHEFGLYEKLASSNNITLLDAVGYFEILELSKNCLFILTDSGGLAQEASAPAIRKKVLIVKKTTEMPEMVTAGITEIVKLNSKDITSSINRTVKNPKLQTRKMPHGRGFASDKLTKIIKKHF